jgi:hypothetical protein
VQLKPWGVSSDREIKIKGRHSRTFYGYADKLLKDEVQLARLAGTPAADSDLAATLRNQIQLSREGLHSTLMDVEA